MEKATREEMLHLISDLSKDATGFRVRLNYNEMTDEHLQATWDGFARQANDSISAEEEAAGKAMQDLETRIIKYMGLGARTREDAIRWDMEANDADSVEYYVMELGLPQSQIYHLQQLLSQTVVL